MFPNECVCVCVAPIHSLQMTITTTMCELTRVLGLWPASTTADRNGRLPAPRLRQCRRSVYTKERGDNIAEQAQHNSLVCDDKICPLSLIGARRPAGRPSSPTRTRPNQWLNSARASQARALIAAISKQGTPMTKHAAPGWITCSIEDEDEHTHTHV